MEDWQSATRRRVDAWHAELQRRTEIILRGHRIYMRVLELLDRPNPPSRKSCAEGRVLRELAGEDDGLAVWQLQRGAGLEATHLSHVLRRLERAGMVTQSTPDGNRRLRIYGATALGRSVGIDYAEEVMVAAMEIIRGFPESTQIHLVRLLHELGMLLEHR